MTTIATSRELNQNASIVASKAEIEPVIITKRGKPNLVLLSFEAYQNLTGRPKTLWDVLTSNEEVAKVNFPEFDRKSFTFKEIDLSEFE